MLFEILRGSGDFPFGENCELKRRVMTRSKNGDSISVKLANDVYTLLMAIDGGDVSLVKDLIISSKKSSRSMSISNSGKNSVNQPKCTCSAEIAMLKETINGLKSDVLLLKQRQVAFENIRKTSSDSIAESIKSLNTELADYRAKIDKDLTSVKSSMGSIENDQHQNITSINKLNSTVHEFKESISILYSNVTNLQESIMQVVKKIEASQMQDNKEVLVTQNGSSNNTDMCNPSLESDTVSKPLNMESDTVMEDINKSLSPETSDTNTKETPTQNENESTNCVKSIGFCSSSFDDKMETDSTFGNMKIPTVITNRDSRKETEKEKSHPHKRRGKTYIGRKINFSVINSEVSSKKHQNRNSTQRGRGYSPPMELLNDDDGDDFEKHIRRKTIQYFVGGFRSTVSENHIFCYIGERDIRVTKVTIHRNYKYDRATICVSVEDYGNTEWLTNDPYFWPWGVVCRPWQPKSRRHVRQSRFDERRQMNEYQEIYCKCLYKSKPILCVR